MDFTSNTKSSSTEIKISTIPLKQTISDIENCNNRINNILTGCKKEIESLTKDVWNSPSKNTIDVELNPYIATFDDLYASLQEYTKYLHMVSDVHERQGAIMTKTVEDSDSGLGGEIL